MRLAGIARENEMPGNTPVYLCYRAGAVEQRKRYESLAAAAEEIRFYKYAGLSPVISLASSTGVFGSPISDCIRIWLQAIGMLLGMR